MRRRWTGAIGLVGLAFTGCATSDDSNFTASATTSPFATGPAGDGNAADATEDADATGDGAGDDDTAMDADDDGGNPTVGPIETGDDEGAPPPAGGDGCCVAQAQPGCADAMIEGCVCAQDPVCCQDAWDDVCVASVAELGCGQCGGNPPPSEPADDDGGPMGGGACCMPQAMPGCADAMVESCVCEADAFCCEQAWDEGCVMAVDELGCGDCGGAVPPPDPGGGGCCMPTGGPGCGDPAIEECICGEYRDVYCCLVDWDDQCAQEVAELGCGAC